MALIEEFDKTGNLLFRKRSFIPLVLYVFAILVIWLDGQESYYFKFTNLSWIITCLGVSFLGMLIRFWVIGYTPRGTSGRNTNEQVAEVLNTKGIYSLVRHPLYLGNFFMWLGIILFVGNWWFTISCCLLFWLYYERIMFAEEMFLRKKFGEAYTQWAETVPSFFPKLTGFEKANLKFSFRNILKREYSGFLATVISFAFIDFAKRYFYFEKIEISRFWLYAFAGALVIAFTLRTLKKTTRVLEIEGR